MIMDYISPCSIDIVSVQISSRHVFEGASTPGCPNQANKATNDSHFIGYGEGNLGHDRLGRSTNKEDGKPR
jgi:hypothetical protein